VHIRSLFFIAAVASFSLSTIACSSLTKPDELTVSIAKPAPRAEAAPAPGQPAAPAAPRPAGAG